MANPSLSVGDHVLVHGGYDPAPESLAAKSAGYTGRVVEFLPGKNETPAALVELDDELVLPCGAGDVREAMVRGRFLVLELVHAGTDWSTLNPRIHVELCDFRPERKRWQDRRPACGSNHMRVIG